MRLTLMEKKAVKHMTERTLTLTKRERCRDEDKKKAKQKIIKLLESINKKVTKDIELESKGGTE